MRGTVLQYDDNAGAGFISGDDGERYRFSRADLQQLTPLARGVPVDFRVDGEDAREIFLLDAAPDAPVLHLGANAQYSRPSSVGPDVVEEDLSGWDYFTRCLGFRYAVFSGRARRSEYWYFTLFIALLMLCIMLVGALFVAADDTGGPVVLIGLVAIVTIWLFLPSLSVSVRRFHDIGFSGWFVLVQLIPYIGTIILLVMMMMPSEKDRNRFGPASYHRD